MDLKRQEKMSFVGVIISFLLLFAGAIFSAHKMFFLKNVCFVLAGLGVLYFFYVIGRTLKEEDRKGNPPV